LFTHEKDDMRMSSSCYHSYQAHCWRSVRTSHASSSTIIFPF